MIPASSIRVIIIAPQVLAGIIATRGELSEFSKNAIFSRAIEKRSAKGLMIAPVSMLFM